jgi:putative membrane protein
MTPKTSVMIAALLAALPIAAHAQTPSAYVATAGASDLFEQTSSKLVLRTTRDAKVKSFATMMVQDHTKSTGMVKAAAAKSRVKAGPPQLTADQKANIASLTKATGAARDQLYWQQQKVAHKAALELHQGYASTGTAAPLKAAATQIVPVVKHHIEMLDGKGMHATDHMGK